MILSPERRFIFIHVPKAAGTSINAALSLHDVFYPARGQDRTARVKCAIDANLPESAADLIEHSTAKHLIESLGREAYSKYYSFGFVRNPWDVAVSWFHYRLITSTVDGYEDAQAAGTFEAYVHRHLKNPDVIRRAELQGPYLVDDENKLAVNFVGRFETLEQDFETVKDSLSIESLPLDHFNQSYHAPWTQLYTPETFAIVAEMVREDAALFGYPTEPDAYGIK